MTRRARRIAARASRIAGTTALLDQRRRHAGGVILAYHRINGAALERHLGTLARRYRIVSLDSLVDHHAAGKSTEGMLAVTFDDGYRTTLLSAVDVATRHDWPMTFFLPTGIVDGAVSYWYLDLERSITACAPDARFAVDVDGVVVNVDGSSPQQSIDAVERIVASRPTLEIESLLADMHRRCTEHRASNPSPALADFQIASWPDVEVAAASPLVTIGAHTVTHARLSELDDVGIRSEMFGSTDEIEHRVGTAVRHLCYPFGDWGSVGSLAPQIARERFASAVTMSSGRVSVDRDPMLLPRVPLYDHDGPDVAVLKVARAR